MTADLTYLAYTAVLTAGLWIPYIACQVMTNGQNAFWARPTTAIQRHDPFRFGESALTGRT